MEHQTQGLFVGLTTLDLMYQVERVPTSDEKIVAIASTVAAGGPATNAAVTFAYVQQCSTASATLLTALGSHPLCQFIKTDLETWGVAIADLSPALSDAPPVSSILVTQSTGERAVVSRNAVNRQQAIAQIPPDILSNIAVVLIDGHQMQVGAAIAQRARELGIPVVVDGGSWKPNFEKVLAHTDYAICSANFYPPGCTTEAEVFAYLRELDIPHIAITRGDRPLRYCTSTHPDPMELAVPTIQAVDTVGAGDVFHGAFCYFLGRSPFAEALAQAAIVAARSCQYFGTRQWMEAKG